jgi:hypothetical protein
LLRTKSLRGAGAVAATAIVALAVSACGSSSSANSGTGSGSGSSTRGQNPLASAKVQACLKKQGVTLPNRGQGGPPSGATGGQPPQGGPPSGATGGQGPGGGAPPGGANSAQFQKLQKALKACGVTMPQGGPQGGQAPSETGTNSNS